MTRQAAWNLLMRFGKSCFTKRIKQWIQFHQLRMPSWSIVNESSTKQAFGAAVTLHANVNIPSPHDFGWTLGNGPLRGKFKKAK